ncbi:MAG TPA: energy transducer TonB [Flavisolibacter sp.]|jgi:protein TonB|nr:energy transducer TonB [Flavisolibacter sp.]
MMVAKDILKADFLDLLFDNRNKQYGAYMLRKTYPKRLLIALAVTVFLGFTSMWLLQPAQADTQTAMVNVRDVVLENIEEVTPPPPPPPPPPKQEAPPPKKTEMVAAKPKIAEPQLERTKFTPPVIKKDEEVKKSEMPPVKEIAVVDVVSTKGVDRDVLAANVPVVADAVNGVDGGKGIIEVKKEEDENKIFEKVEIAASVNISQWRRHLERNLMRYIEEAAYDGMEPGQYTVNVRFLVEKDGSISKVQALNDPGYGLGKGAVQVVKSGPKWSPGEQNGRKVRSYHTQPITFVIMEV